MPQGFIIAIDGPVASGKGTLASALAKELNGFYLYTGDMYRSVALLCINKGLDLANEGEVESVLPDVQIDFDNYRVLLNGQDVTERIKEPDTASGASVVGVYPKVREVLVKKQQEIGQKAAADGKIVVSEGRDTGTTVFPDAEFKLYLTATDAVRAKRRLFQYASQENKDFKNELKELVIRDERDKGRKTSPLPDNPEQLGYFVLDNSDMTNKQTLDEILGELKNRKLI